MARDVISLREYKKNKARRAPGFVIADLLDRDGPVFTDAPQHVRDQLFLDSALLVDEVMDAGGWEQKPRVWQARALRRVAIRAAHAQALRRPQWRRITL